MNQNTAALKINNLTVNYGKTSALWDVSLEIPQGNLVAIIGPNGAGKSTLIKSCLDLVKPISGQVMILGSKLKSVQNRIAYVPQKESVDWDFPITVFDLVLMGCYGRLKLFFRPTKSDKEEVYHYLKEVGIENLANRQIGELSGGQKQRAFIARALFQKADLYFLDEPFAGIDITSSDVILEILLKLKNQGKTLVVVHHDLESVATAFNWSILLNLRLIAHGPIEQVFTKEMMAKAYGKENFVLDQVVKTLQAKREGLAK